ncbi:hypothetical protein [Paenibacillus jiagnxiensis]|uniref:hypothetical protein n=1 Tax=Paenibacillus jiagnxiensis TaxID=3228926 RepID=UPI0033AB7AC9
MNKANLINEQVDHSQFGAGQVVKHGDGRITVLFSSIGPKTFLYPEAFEHHLKMRNPVLHETVLAEYVKKQKQLIEEKNRQAQQLKEEAEQLAAKKAVKSKKSAQTKEKKPVSSKLKATKNSENRK